jgi:ribosomal protein S18 acetylase RimI-like enzyme
MSGIVIRRAGPADLDVLAPLFDAYRQFYGLPADAARARAYLAERLSREESVVLLALAGDSPGGFTQLYPSFSSLACRPMWILSDLFVVPSQRRRGLGRRLMETAHQFARDRHAVAVELDTAHTNTPAQALYEALGYRRDETFRHYVLRL